MNPMMNQKPQAQPQPPEDEYEEDMEAPEEGEDMEQPMPQQGMEQGVPTINGEDLQMLLLDRVRQLNPQEMQVLDSIITPESIMVLFKIFPELGVLFEKGTQVQGMAGGGGQGMNPQMPQQDPAAPQASPAQFQGQQEEEPNPLSNPNISRGLTGY